MNAMSSAVFTGLPLAMGLSVLGCSTQPVCGDPYSDLVTDKNLCSSTGTGGRGGGGGAGGAGGSGGMAGVLIPGAQYVPQSFLPPNNAVLPKTNVFMAWSSPSSVPSGEVAAGYQICTTAAGISGIDGDEECPGAVTTDSPFQVVAGPIAGSGVFWKMRSLFASGNFSSWSPVNNYSVDQSLAGWWPFDDSGTDASGLGHDAGLQNGAVYGTGKLKKALQLDGADDQVLVADSADYDFGTSDFTLAAWLYPQRDNQAEALLTKRSAANGYELYRTASGQLAFYGSGCGIAVQGGNVVKNDWSHVVAERTGGLVSLYVNGILAASGACPDNFSNSAGLAMGCNGPLVGCVEPFLGGLDEVLVRKSGSPWASVVNEFCADSTLAGVSPLPPVCNP